MNLVDFKVHHVSDVRLGHNCDDEIIKHIMYIRVVPHAQDASHHQYYYICLGSGIGDPYKPLIATITGRGGHPKLYTRWVLSCPVSKDN